LLESRRVEYYQVDYNKVEKANKKIKRQKRKFKNMVLTILLCSTAILLTCRYVKITQLNYEINSLEKELATINGENQNLNVKLAETENLKEIENIARTKLHMHEPLKEDVVYVVVDNYHVAKSEPPQKPTNNNYEIGNFFIKIFGTIIR